MAVANRSASEETPKRGGTGPSPASRARRIAVDGAERYALLVFTALIIAIFALDSTTGPTFFTVANLRTVLGNEAVVATIALAVMVPLIGGEFDVSVGSVAGMSSIVAASAMADGWSLVAAIVLALVISAIVGFVNGVLVAYVGVNSFITTLAAGTLLGGLVSLHTHDQTIIEGISTSLTKFGNADLLGLPWIAWVVVAIGVVLGFLLGWTVYGRELTSVGASKAAARLVGIRVNAVVASSFVISSTLAGAAGIILLARTGSGNPQVGQGYTLAALSAAFLGATAFRPGQFNVPGTLLGVIFVAVSVNGLTLAGASDWVEPVFTGAALMVAVALSTTLGRLRAAGADRGQDKEAADG